MLDRATRLLTALVATATCAAALASCGSDDTDPAPPKWRVTTLHGRRVVQAPDGTRVVMPKLPTRSVRVAGRKCGTVAVQPVDGEMTNYASPPAPGLRAKRLGERKVTVRVTAPKQLGRCPYDGLRLTIDSYADQLPGRSVEVPPKPGLHELTLALPPSSGRVEILTASTRGGGTSSKPAAIRIDG